MRFASSLAALLSAGAAHAACPGITQLEMNDCALRAFQAADGALNAAWAPAKAQMDGLGQGELLLDAQRKWIAFRDSACTAEIAPYEGGSIRPLIWYRCLERLTRDRTRDLEGFRF